MSAALDCLTKMEQADAPEQVKSMVQDLIHVPPEALMPAFQRLLALAKTNPELMTPLQLSFACGRVSSRLEREPDRLAEFAAAAPEGPIRDEFLRVLDKCRP